MNKRKLDDRTTTERPSWLKNGNPVGDPNSAPRCGAQTRQGRACQSPAMANRRCRMHGGTSTGPRTAEGLARSRRARWKHGLYSGKTRAEHRRVRELLIQSRALLKQIQAR